MEAPGPEQIPEGLAQQPEAQSAALRHCPPINCCPLPLPTFLAPEGSNGGPPWAGAANATLAGEAAGAAAAAAVNDELTPASPNPQPVFPA